MCSSFHLASSYTKLTRRLSVLVSSFAHVFQLPLRLFVPLPCRRFQPPNGIAPATTSQFAAAAAAAAAAGLPVFGETLAAFEHKSEVVPAHNASARHVAHLHPRPVVRRTTIIAKQSGINQEISRAAHDATRTAKPHLHDTHTHTYCAGA